MMTPSGAAALNDAILEATMENLAASMRLRRGLGAGTPELAECEARIANSRARLILELAASSAAISRLNEPPAAGAWPHIKECEMTNETENQIVVVRCRDAGVHVGTLISRNGREVVLADARRIWRWRGANTLNEVAANGVEPGTGRGGYTRVSEPVAQVELLEACEIITATAAAAASIASAGWAK